MNLKLPFLGKNTNYSLLIFQLLGLQYFSLGTLRTERKLKCVRKWPTIGYTIYFVILFVIVTAQNVIGVLMLERHIDYASIVKQMAINFMQFGTTSVFTLSAMLLIVLSFISTHHQKMVFVNLISISEQFENLLQVKTDYAKFRKRIIIKLAILFVIYLMLYFVLLELERYNNTGFDRYLNWVAITIFRIVFSGMLFVYYVDLITFNLKYLEDVLLDIHSNKFHQTVSIERDFFVSVKLSAKYYDTIYRKMTHVKNIYGLLWETSIKVNDAMGKILLSYIVVSVVSVTASGYSSFITIANGLPFMRVIGAWKYRFGIRFYYFLF